MRERASEEDRRSNGGHRGVGPMRHPMTVLVDVVGGEERALLVAIGVPVLVVVLADGTIATVGGGAFVVAMIALAHRGHREDQREGRVADLQAQYADGEISLDEFETRIELVLDPRAVEIRDAVEAADDVGPATSANIALALRRQGKGVDAITDADPERLEAIHGVGPKRARSIVDAISSERTVADGGRSR